MTVIKCKATANYTIVPNETSQDKLINFDSRGLLLYMLSLPSNWEFRMESLIKESPNAGREKLQRMIKELEEAGYIIRKMNRTKEGKFTGMLWTINPERDYRKTKQTMKKIARRADPLRVDPAEIKKDIYTNSSSNIPPYFFSENFDSLEKDNDSFFLSVVNEIKDILNKTKQTLTFKVQLYIEMKIEEYINRYPTNTSKADCCMYVIQAVDSMQRKRT